MKMYRRLIVWGMLSILIQITGILFLEEVVFKESSEFKISETDTKKNKDEATVSISSNATNIKVSLNGKYILYQEDGKYIVKNLKNSEDREVITENNGEILYIDWIQDTNNLMIAEKIKSSSGGQTINLIAYMANNGRENQIKEICSYQNGMEVDFIASSGTTGSNYVSVSRGGYTPSIYRININEQQTKVSTNAVAIGAMKAFQQKEVIVYEDRVNKNFYSTKKDTSTKLNFVKPGNLTLLGVDNSNNIYMGELEGNKVSKIIYGKDDTATSTWVTIELDKAVKVNDINISKKSEIYINDNLEGKIKNLSTGNTISYRGEYIQVTNKSLFTISNGTIYIKDLSNIDEIEGASQDK